MANTPASRPGQMTIELIGSTVVFTLRLSDQYRAMMLYDKACKAATDTGNIVLTVDGAIRVPDADDA